MLLSQTSHYAVSGVVRLAGLRGDAFCRVEDLTRGTGAPRYAVAKVFHDLVKRGVLVSVRGTGGGFRLADGAERLTLMDVVEAVDGPWDRSALSDRGLGAPGLPCPLTALLQPVQDQLERLLLTTCVADVAGRASAAANAAPLFCPTGQPQDRPPQGVTKPRADAARCAGLPIYDREDPS